MKDRYIIGLIVLGFVAFVVVFGLMVARLPAFTYAGLPAGATCGADHDGVRTCVGEGRIYTCAMDYRSRTAQCAAGRPPELER